MLLFQLQSPGQPAAQDTESLNRVSAIPASAHATSLAGGGPDQFTVRNRAHGAGNRQAMPWLRPGASLRAVCTDSTLPISRTASVSECPRPCQARRRLREGPGAAAPVTRPPGPSGLGRRRWPLKAQHSSAAGYRPVTRFKPSACHRPRPCFARHFSWRPPSSAPPCHAL